MATPNGLATVSRAVVSAAAELAASVGRAVAGDVRTARGNAYEAICADRARTQARHEMDALVRALLADGARRAAPAMPQVSEGSRRVADGSSRRAGELVSAGSGR